MFTFILGVLLGMGLTLAVRSVHRTLLLRRLHRERELNNAVHAMAAQMFDNWKQDATSTDFWGEPISR